MGCSELKDKRKEKEDIIEKGIIQAQKVNNSLEIQISPEKEEEKDIKENGKEKVTINGDEKTSSNENKSIIKERKSDKNNDNQKIINSIDNSKNEEILKENKIPEEKSKNENLNNDNKNSEKEEKKSDNNEYQPPPPSNQFLKTYTNEGNDINDINNYNKFNQEENMYYLICPDCNKNIIKIISVEYQQEKKDFKVTYNCFCPENSTKYFYQIISKDKGSCDSHRSDLNFLCEDCFVPLCDECLEEHKNHNKKNIINKTIISEEIFEEINTKKNEFEGIYILQKIFDFYKSYDDTFKFNKEIVNNPLNGSEEVKNSLNFNILVNNKENKNLNELLVIEDQVKNIQEQNNISSINYKNIKTLKGNEECISCLIKLENNNLATGSYDGLIKIWDITKEESKALIMIKKAIGTAFCLLEFEQGKLLGGTNANLINLWDINDINITDPIHNFEKHYLWVQALVKCDENHFASASNDTKIIIWNYSTKKYENTLEGHSDCILDMIILQNGYLCSASADKTIRIWDWKNLKSLFYFNAHYNKYVKCILELNNKYLITGSEDNTIGIWEEKSGNYENIKFLKEHTSPVRGLCQINDNYFASGSFDNKIKIWDLNKFECVQTLEGHDSIVIKVIKYDEDIIISCSGDKTIKIWKKN